MVLSLNISGGRGSPLVLYLCIVKQLSGILQHGKMYTRSCFRFSDLMLGALFYLSSLFKVVTISTADKAHISHITLCRPL